MKTAVHVLLALFLSSSQLGGQPLPRKTLSGHIRDVESGEELIGANVFFPQIEKGGISNVYGFYSVTLPAGVYQVRYSYLGYQESVLEVDLGEDRILDVELKPAPRQLEAVVVSAQAADRNISASEMSIARIDVRETGNIPVIFGEQDVLKTIQLLPGIQAAGEGSSGFYVRGGDAGQNLIILDEAPVYNASHLLGFFSVFNSDAVKDVTVYKGGIPAEYGGRISSVLDVKMREGNRKEHRFSGGIGLISSRFLAEGPLWQDNSAFLLTGRRTYADLFLKLSPDTLLNKNKLYFYDLNVKANTTLGPNDRLFLSGYFGRDVFKFRDIFGFDWGNATGTLRWNHLFNKRLFLNTTLIFSNYNYRFNISQGGNGFMLTSSIRDYSWKEDFQYYIGSGSTLRFGLANTCHVFNPGEVSASGDVPVNDTKLENKQAIEQEIYASHEIELGGFLSLVYGIRFSGFSSYGPGNVYRFDEYGNVLDTVRYGKGKRISTWFGSEPRLLVHLRTGTGSAVKASYTRNYQYLHLLSNSTASTPIDLWVPSSAIVKPQRADQLALGYFRNFRENQYESSLEVYYKDMKNQIDYRNGADIFLNDLVESQLVFGRGWSYGTELMIRKNYGKLHGWISYTLSRTERQFDRINDGRPFPARQDRSHDISVVGLFDISRRWSVSATWVFSTGDAVTFPSGKYIIEGQYINYFTERNGYRMPDYHRLDLSISLYSKPGRKYSSGLNFSAYNIYARKNAYSILFEQSESDPAVTVAKKIYLFSIVPSLTYNFKF